MPSLPGAVRRAAVLAAVLLAGSAVAQPLPQLPPIDRMVVRKAARTMELFAGDRRVHTLTGLQLGGAPVGPKRFEGDRRTPEGRYTIDYGNPNSAYHLSLHISYPSPADTAHAAAQGRSAGGMIFIHGQPNGWTSGDGTEAIPGDWTDGCIAVSDGEIEMLWAAVADGTAIEILP
jgi:murein L,D-transpeptidase YafK